MALFCPLYSGSSGNCVYLDSGKTKVLIDLGVSCRAAVTALSSLDVDPKDLSANPHYPRTFRSYQRPCGLFKKNIPSRFLPPVRCWISSGRM